VSVVDEKFLKNLNARKIIWVGTVAIIERTDTSTNYGLQKVAGDEALRPRYSLDPKSQSRFNEKRYH
jgi:hypothetical protein